MSLKRLFGNKKSKSKTTSTGAPSTGGDVSASQERHSTDNHTSEGAAPSGTKPLYEYQPLKLSRPLFALLIGINKYQHYGALNGAVEDVNNIAYFLASCLAIPPSHITKLLNEGATATAITQAIRSLGSGERIRRGDAVFIYFSGHGARVTAPSGWETPDGKVEAICPVDMCIDEDDTPTLHSAAQQAGPAGTRMDTPGIPDFVLNALITELAGKVGENITVIFDCCHSSNSLRNKNGKKIRKITNPPRLPDNWQSILGLTGLNFGKAVDLRSLDCAVLLAACGRLQEAEEDEQGGLFTRRLLENLSEMTSEQLGELTYKDLVESLVISDSQDPQCEGFKSYRYLFREEMANQSFISGSQGDDGDFVLDAGVATGIKVGIEFDIYNNNILSPDNPPRGRLTVKSTSQATSILSVDEQTYKPPSKFFAIQAGFPEDSKIKVHCLDIETLNDTILSLGREFSGFAYLVDTADKADLLVSFADCVEGKKKCRECSKGNHKNILFDWADDDLFSPGSSARIGKPISLSQPDKIARVFRAATLFRYYLRHGDDDPLDRVEVALHRLKTEIVKIDGMSVRKRTPIPENLLKDGKANIHMKKGKAVDPYGLTISNHTDGDLLPQVFWFECRDLTIDPWYTNQHGGGENRTVDAPLRARKSDDEPGKFGIGYGEVSHQPWKFEDDGQGEAVGFFKIFFGSFNVNSEFIVQKSPFGAQSRKGGAFKDEVLQWSAAQRVKVVQLAP